MTESEFNRQIDATLLAIEEAADASSADIDYENSGGVLTLTLGNGSQVIINRQTLVRQLWVAARSGGFHFNFDSASGEWRRDSDGAELFAVLSRVISEQGGETVALSKKPVSAAAMFVNGEVGWLGFASTLKKYRKRGGQSALFARRIQDGLALGCKWFVTETGEDTPEDPNPSYHNMLRSGFRLAYLRRNYVHQPPASPVKEVRRALFATAYSLRYEWQRLTQQRNAG